MRAVINVRHLAAGPVELQGRLTLKEMDIDPMDPLVHVHEELAYDLVVQKVERGILARGKLQLALECECSRCLTAYTHPVRLDHWICHLPFDGEERVRVVNDLVDLTPYLREDIVLAFPQRPLCKPECKGLSRPPQEIPAGGSQAAATPSSAWAELNKLKL